MRFLNLVLQSSRHFLSKSKTKGFPRKNTSRCGRFNFDICFLNESDCICLLHLQLSSLGMLYRERSVVLFLDENYSTAQI